MILPIVDMARDLSNVMWCADRNPTPANVQEARRLLASLVKVVEGRISIIEGNAHAIRQSPPARLPYRDD